MAVDEQPVGRLSMFHRLFDRLYPMIRFVHERLRGHAWFTQIEPHIWLGGAPTYGRDYQFLLDHGITAVLNIRAERSDETAFYGRHGITHIRFRVPDVAVPDETVITAAVDWLVQQLADGRTVLVHCAKGRGRSATLLAGYLMRERGMSFEAARDFLKSKRSLAKLEERHGERLRRWLAHQGTATACPELAGDRLPTFPSSGVTSQEGRG